MIIVKLCGGLGNQLFQYAFAREFVEYGREVYLDLSWFQTCGEREYLLRFFNISINELNEDDLLKFKNECRFIEIPFVKRKYYISENNRNIEKKLWCVDNVIIDGYWQSEVFFRICKQNLKKEIVLREISGLVKKWAEIIEDKKIISVHVRRGDYLLEKNVGARGEICTYKYYEKAINLMNQKVRDCKFLFFSDDIEWVEEKFVGENIYYFDEPVNDAESLYLMSLCSHHIIANSTYSWWGAWINDHDEKIVIAPKKWNNLKDMSKIYLDKWILI